MKKPLNIYESLNHTIKSQTMDSGLSHDKIEGLTHLMALHVYTIATQFAKYVKEKDIHDYEGALNEFYPEHYNFGY